MSIEPEDDDPRLSSIEQCVQRIMDTEIVYLATGAEQVAVATSVIVALGIYLIDDAQTVEHKLAVCQAIVDQLNTVIAVLQEHVIDSAQDQQGTSDVQH